MWDPRYAELAAVRLREAQLHASSEAVLPAAAGLLRRRLGAVLVHLGERVAAQPAGWPAPAAR